MSMLGVRFVRCLALLASFALLALAAPAPPASAADGEGPLAWVILDTLKPGSTAEYIRLVTENYGPVLDAMMAEGKILGWGIAEKANSDGGYTHAGWVVYPNWTAHAAVEEAFGAAFADATPEDQARIAAGFAELTEPREHLIRYLRGVVFEIGTAETPPSYLITGDWHTTPGNEEEATALFMRAKPMFDRLLADGAITGFGVYQAEMHDGGSSHVTWFTATDLGAMDKVNAAFAAAGDDGPSPADMAAAFDMAAHRDSIWQIRHLGGGGGEQNGDGGDDDGQ